MYTLPPDNAIDGSRSLPPRDAHGLPRPRPVGGVPQALSDSLTTWTLPVSSTVTADGVRLTALVGPGQLAALAPMEPAASMTSTSAAIGPTRRGVSERMHGINLDLPRHHPGVATWWTGSAAAPVCPLGRVGCPFVTAGPSLDVPEDD